MNLDKCHLILSSNDENEKIELNGEVINNTQTQKLLGAHIDYKLKFDEHIETLCKKFGKKFSCPVREFLGRYKSVTIQNRNIQVLLTEIFKEKNGVATEIMTEIFNLKTIHMIVCSCHVTYPFQSVSTLYISLNVKELHASNRR